MKADIMIIAAHPDDAEIAMGATIASMVDQGASIVVVDLTTGEPTPFGTPERRRTETEQASAVLGIKERVNLDLGNRTLTDGIEERKSLAACIRQYRPEILFIPYHEDAHPDHIAASRLCVSARFYAKLTKWDIPGDPWYPQRWYYYYSLHFRPVIVPQVLYNVSAWMEVKQQSLQCYVSQFVEPEQNRVIFDRIQQEAHYWGSLSGCTYAEPFGAVEPIRFDSYQQFLRNYD